VVDIGVRAFLPGSQYDLRGPAQNLDKPDRHGNPACAVTKLNRPPLAMWWSVRRALLEEELHAQTGCVNGNAERRPGRARPRERT